MGIQQTEKGHRIPSRRPIEGKGKGEMSLPPGNGECGWGLGFFVKGRGDSRRSDVSLRPSLNTSMELSPYLCQLDLT